MKQLVGTLVAIFSGMYTAGAQLATQENILISELYSQKGAISVSHLQEEIETGIKNSRLRLFVPFNATPKQTWALDASIQNLSLLSDNSLETHLGLNWQMHLSPNITGFAGTEFRHSAYGINKMLKTTMYSDPLAAPQNFSTVGIGAAVGVLHNYFWLIGKYNRNFHASASQQNINYLHNNLHLTAGLRFLVKNWEFRVPAEIENVLEFKVEQLFFGTYVAYNENYLSFKTNTLWDLNFELSLLPYHWLRLGVMYQTHSQTALSSYGTSGSYNWKPKNLDL